MRKTSGLAIILTVAALAVALVAPPAPAQVCNVKVVTDASPDYYDMDSMIRSITAKWDTPKDKCWALFYWFHINRRQMSPMWLHGCELTDPIMQWNDYGFTMCSTICGINCSTWAAMGFPVRHWEIQNHTVPEVFYDGRWHMYDNSMSAIYTLCDGKTIAGTEDIGKTQACDASGGRAEFAHIAKYHCLNATGKGEKACLTGADCNRELKQEGICFNPNKIRNQNDLWWDRGHRYILNLHPGEAYTRYYYRLDENSPNRVLQSEKGKQKYEADPAYFVPNHRDKKSGGKDPQCNAERYHIRGNGVRTWTPDLMNLQKAAYSVSGISVRAPAKDQAHDDVVKLVADKAGQAGAAVFMVEGANVITSLNIKATAFRKTDRDAVRIFIAEPFWRKDDPWKKVYEAAATGQQGVDVKLIDEVNGSYFVLVKVELTGQADAADASLSALEFTTITEVNSKALPKLNIGKNTIYVGTGDQSEAIVLWPDLRGEDYQKYVVEQSNVVTEETNPQVIGGMHLKEAGQPGSVVFRLDTPRDMTRVVYGGRLHNKGAGSKITYEHSFDSGKNWTADYKLEGNKPPWDVIQYVTIDKVPAATRSALFRYTFSSDSEAPKEVGLFNVRMEADYKPADEGFKPIEVTWTWKERQEDYSTITRSHTQVIDKVPCRYEVNVGGVDHPQVDSVRIALAPKGGATTRPGYSDGKDAAGAKYVPFWQTLGTNFAEGKSYTCSIPSATEYNAGDKEGEHKLTDGYAWCSDGGGLAYSYGWYWSKVKAKDLLITVDLEKAQKLGAFRIHVHGYPWWDAIKGEFKDTVEVLTSNDNKDFASQGFFNMKLRWKDLPVNYMWPDSEQLQGYMFDLILPKPVEARYVQYKINSPRAVAVTEVEALDFIKREPFDLRITLPDEKVPPASPETAARSRE